MKRLRNILTVILLALGMLLPATVRAENTVDVKEIVFGHIGDSYEWHITTWGETHVTIPLPVIVHSSTTGWHAFLSSRLEENGGSYEGFSIAPAGSKYEGKLVEYDAIGNEIRPLDISITKVTLALLINSALLLVIILSVAHWYRKHPQGSAAPGGFIGFMEMFIMMVNDDIIKSCVGIFTKPFALMIRLFANMLAGHMAMLVLTCLIFISASMGPALNGTLTVASVLFNIFMNALELLVAFIQAYVFTMLSAVFIGLAQEEHKEKAVK